MSNTSEQNATQTTTQASESLISRGSKWAKQNQFKATTLAAALGYGGAKASVHVAKKGVGYGRRLLGASASQAAETTTKGFIRRRLGRR